MSTLAAMHLSKAYKKRQVVKDVSLTVTAGEVVGLLGPNGAGKTTCFYMMIGLVHKDQGRILLDDVDIGDAPMHKRAKLGVGYLPQEASVFRKLSVEENILAILETIDGLDAAGRKARLEELLADLHIADRRKTLGMSLSGGERRRVEIARALATKPRFMLLDEPFAGVDPISVIDIQKHISHLRGLGIGVLITDHNVRETLKICDRAYIINDGHVLASGNPASVLADPDVRRVYLGENFVL
ncbi:LPS export ABC transporter ATP-binding protein [Acidiferrobacter thiooxydans]|uniref:Lipopolysaccharide export system ATP-binding protein LptB n=1 Tax=Acidiferrobacter thiooxydans TaxID=163359 RepID=A0A1C2FY44_9GAMM|nr:LPS export ABC transporter ATP-binding protein [Acidiferrobacter thiooxydans]RCN56718.1 LPS export ABC transporter ATP-binding protein [Acidiferrobacter thiooxydans]UEN99394.1 LPS export ABC transporter ATP-binding protein [Acidiferrobacter thiooxydans]